SQTWADGEGLLLAKQLLRSGVQVRQNLSVYQLSSLNRRFDIILCLGVYYHLLDPFYAFAQIRHCCHPGTVVLLEGDRAPYRRGGDARSPFGNGSDPLFVPSSGALEGLLKSAYLKVQSQALLSPPPKPPKGLKRLLHRLKYRTWPPPREQVL